MINDDDDAPQLSAETLKILQEWQKEQQENQAANIPREDWVCPRCFHPRYHSIILAIESILV